MTDEKDQHPKFTKFRDKRLQNPAVRAAYDEAKARRDETEKVGRPLGAASGGDPGFWDWLGCDEYLCRAKKAEYMRSYKRNR